MIADKPPSTALVRPEPKRRSYSDATKPRPLLRGTVHGCVSLSIAIALVALLRAEMMPKLSLALLLKLATYASSATFHLFPFPNMKHETRCFIADIAAVPLSAVGSIVPFVVESNAKLEICLAVGTLLANAVCVAQQTRGQIGLATPSGRSDVPRTVCVCLYVVHSFVVTGRASSFCAAWVAMLLLSAASVVFADFVAKAHAEEPTARWARWHREGWWSFHEDFHLALLGVDLCWLVLALRFLH